MSLDTFQIVVLIGLLAQFIIFPVYGYRKKKKTENEPWFKSWKESQTSMTRKKTLPKGCYKNNESDTMNKEEEKQFWRDYSKPYNPWGALPKKNLNDVSSNPDDIVGEK